jgi:peptide/nickel transport system permease protein
MIGLVLRGLGRAVLVLVTVATIVFVLVHLSGDPIAGFTPPGASPEQQAVLRHELGLDRSLVTQYGIFLRDASTGDFGDSWRARRPALNLVLTRLPATLRLTLAAIAIAIVVGGLLAIAAARRPGGIVDTLSRLLALLGQATPGFWLGTMLILVFAVRLKWLPSSGDESWRALILPAVTLAVYPAGMIARLLRGGLIEARSADYARTAQSKGLSGAAIVGRHLLPNASVPVLGYLGLQVSFLIGGAVVVESVFAYPGIGRLAMQAVSDRDLPVIQAFVVVIAAFILIVNLVVEVIAAWIDPRLRGERQLVGASA